MAEEKVFCGDCVHFQKDRFGSNAMRCGVSDMTTSSGATCYNGRYKPSHPFLAGHCISCVYICREPMLCADSKDNYYVCAMNGTKVLVDEIYSKRCGDYKTRNIVKFVGSPIKKSTIDMTWMTDVLDRVGENIDNRLLDEIKDGVKAHKSLFHDELLNEFCDKKRFEPHFPPPEEGLKHDHGKPRMDLLPFDALYEVAKVLSFGADKYSENSWMNVDPKRYEAAMLRHLAKYKAGEIWDEESKLSHLSHLACNALFILAISCKGEKQC